MIYIHLLSLLFLSIVIVIADKEGLAWMRGKKETLSSSLLVTFHTLVWAGLVAMIFSGFFLFLPLKEYFIQTPAFYAKMLFVLALVINSFFIGKFMKVASERPFRELMKKEKTPILVSGAVSGIGWLGAFVSALFMSTNQWLFYFWSLVF